MLGFRWRLPLTNKYALVWPARIDGEKLCVSLKKAPHCGNVAKYGYCGAVFYQSGDNEPPSDAGRPGDNPRTWASCGSEMSDPHRKRVELVIEFRLSRQAVYHPFLNLVVVGVESDPAMSDLAPAWYRRRPRKSASARRRAEWNRPSPVRLHCTESSPARADSKSSANRASSEPLIVRREVDRRLSRRALTRK